MNLYTPMKHINERARHVNSHTIYLATLAKENPNVDVELKLITTLSNRDKKLYVLSSAGKFYLTPNYILGVGMENILYSSSKLSRVTNYGNKILQQ